MRPHLEVLEAGSRFLLRGKLRQCGFEGGQGMSAASRLSGGSLQRVVVLREPVGNLDPRAQLEFLQDVMDVRAYGAGRDEERIGDLSVGLPGGNQPRHFELASRE